MEQPPPASVVTVVLLGEGVRHSLVDARQRPLVRLRALAADFAGLCEGVEPLDLALAEDPRGIVERQPADELADPVAQLQGEVGGGRAHQLADVFHGHAVIGALAPRLFGFGHVPQGSESTRWISSRESMRDWAGKEIVVASPINQA